MYKNQMILQRITSFLLLAAAVLVFVYSLGLMTDVYESYYLISSYDPVWDPLFYVEGSDIYFTMQDFNKQLTAAGIVLILSAVSLFVFRSHDRRKYYIANYITIGANAVLNILVVTWMRTEVLNYRAQFNKIDINRVNEVAELLAMEIKPSTFWFDASQFVAITVICVTVLSIINLGLKIALMIGERNLVKQGLEESYV